MRWRLFAIACFSSLPYFTFAQLPNTSSLPNCGQYCVQNATDYVSSAGECKNGNSYCLCLRGNFDQSVKNCANATCTAATDLAAVNAWTDGYCEDALAVTRSHTYSTNTMTSSVSASSTTLSTSASKSSPTSSDPTSISATQPLNAAAAASNTTTPNTNDTQTKDIGLGIGIPLGILCIVVLAILLWQVNRRKKSAEDQRALPVHEIDGSEIPSELPAPFKANVTPPPLTRHRERTPSPDLPVQGAREQQGFNGDGRAYGRPGAGPTPMSGRWNEPQVSPITPVEPSARNGYGYDENEPHAL